MATDAISRVVQLQREDCLHACMVPGVLMRFLTSMLDFPTLALMASFFRETEMPVVSVQSALEFVSAQRIADAADRQKMVDYINKCLRDGMLCMASEMGGDLSEARNVMLYVSAKPFRSTPSSLRMTFNPAEATNKDVKAVVARKLRENVLEVLRTPLVEISQFCKVATVLRVVGGQGCHCARGGCAGPPGRQCAEGPHADDEHRLQHVRLLRRLPQVLRSQGSCPGRGRRRPLRRDPEHG